VTNTENRDYEDDEDYIEAQFAERNGKVEDNHAGQQSAVLAAGLSH